MLLLLPLLPNHLPHYHHHMMWLSRLCSRDPNCEKPHHQRETINSKKQKPGGKDTLFEVWVQDENTVRVVPVKHSTAGHRVTSKAILQATGRCTGKQAKYASMPAPLENTTKHLQRSGTTCGDNPTGLGRWFPGPWWPDVVQPVLKATFLKLQSENHPTVSLVKDFEAWLHLPTPDSCK